MIHEFGIEPELVAQWGADRKEYRFIHGKIGLGQPRMLSGFPKLAKWRKAVIDAGNALNDDMALQRITALAQAIGEAYVQRDCSLWDGSQSWLENAERDHERCRFHLILAQENPRNNGRVLSRNVIGEPGDHRWDLPRTRFVARTADELAGALAPMLSNCSEVHLIDPHFGPEDYDYRATLEAFLRAIGVNRGGPAPALVEVITSERSTAEFFATECQTKLPRHIPAGMSIGFKRLKARGGGAELHNRYVLTDIGGVTLGRGLDRGETGQSEDIALLERDHYLQRWQEYIGPDPAFDPAEPPINIVGTG